MISEDRSTAYPLKWPEGWKRSTTRSHARFRTSFAKARDMLIYEVKKFGGTRITISTDIPIRNDGYPYATYATPRDPGVAVYFWLKGEQVSFANDTWYGIENNMYAIALTINALRGINRWGSTEMQQRAYTGFMALPAAPSEKITVKTCWQVLELNVPTKDVQKINAARKKLAVLFHPDISETGDADKMAEINKAHVEATDWARGNQ